MVAEHTSRNDGQVGCGCADVVKWCFLVTYCHRIACSTLKILPSGRSGGSAASAGYAGTHARKQFCPQHYMCLLRQLLGASMERHIYRWVSCNIETPPDRL